MNIINELMEFYMMKFENHKRLYNYLDIPSFEKAGKTIKAMEKVIPYIAKRNRRQLKWYDF